MEQTTHAKPRRPIAPAIALTLSLVGCGFVHDERVDGPYRLVAVDVSEDMSVCYDLGNGCIGRIEETVFAVGWDKDYIVAARHPHEFLDTTIDKSKTEYFYVVRALDGPGVHPSVCVRGPFTASQFESERVRLSLPQFSKTPRAWLDDLR